ncbi:chaperone protein dnaJ 11, chloroplastic-like [Canna indica]|uniref:Chaperone protein dnaJ 11, chloroplastic-like n=1 Tax=Canna indica TaxID=4628 RepID=A0AAQ3JSF4_9LILI|nr:chaperone protein dnaJ 11, chloroplastic-like [Canna indica]
MISSRSLSFSKPTSLGAPCLTGRRTTRCAAVATPHPASAAAGRSATLYEILGIAASASGLEIKAAYRRLARSCHPDAVAADRKGASANEFMRVHAAYETLSDPEKRAEYDREVMAAVALASRRRWRPFYSPPSYSYSAEGRRCRTWETDQCW